MIRAGRNYKKVKQMPDWDVNRLAQIMEDAVKTPPDHVKQPYDTNQPYQPATFAEAMDKECLKKSG